MRMNPWPVVPIAFTRRARKIPGRHMSRRMRCKACRNQQQIMDDSPGRTVRYAHSPTSPPILCEGGLWGNQTCVAG